MHCDERYAILNKIYTFLKGIDYYKTYVLSVKVCTIIQSVKLKQKESKQTLDLPDKHMTTLCFPSWKKLFWTMNRNTLTSLIDLFSSQRCLPLSVRLSAVHHGNMEVRDNTFLHFARLLGYSAHHFNETPAP